MLGQRRRRWSNIETTLGQRGLFTGLWCDHERKNSCRGHQLEVNIQDPIQDQDQRLRCWPNQPNIHDTFTQCALNQKYLVKCMLASLRMAGADPRFWIAWAFGLLPVSLIG